jgi:signal transduction histidine kinase
VKLNFIPGSDNSFIFRSDPQRVQQILINLLTNACKHTVNGEIRIGYSLTENPGEVTFYVEDTGPGIPADQAERIFERFTKLDELVQGPGLGLSICREIADKMSGRVFFDTSYTGGARFVFALPANR